jgi:hypothetical protein
MAVKIPDNLLSTNQKLTANNAYIIAAYKAAYGKSPSASILQRFAGKKVSDVNLGIFGPQYTTQLQAFQNPTANTNTSTDTSTTNTTPATPVPLAQSYSEWLAGAGASYDPSKQSYSSYDLNDPNSFYGQQLAKEENDKLIAKQNLDTNLADTTKNTGINYNNSGLYGSGIYQQSLDRSLTDLNKGFDQSWGTGAYTPYALRKAQIQESARVAKAGQENTAGSNARSAYDMYVQEYNRTHPVTGV